MVIQVCYAISDVKIMDTAEFRDGDGMDNNSISKHVKS